jgi:DNA-binding transcriptional MerR regulator
MRKGAVTMSRHYTIGEVAKLTSVPVKTIRHYADSGILPPAKRTAANYRLFDQRSVWQLELIRTLRHLDFSLDEIKEILAGRLEIPTAIDLQITAIDQEIEHLSTVRDLLRQARESLGDEDQQLDLLRRIGQAVTMSQEQRGRELVSGFAAMMSEEPLPETWTDHLLQSARQHLPEHPTPEQAAAWAELLALLEDEQFLTATREHGAGFWQMTSQSNFDAEQWNAKMAEINDRGLAAYHAGASPESDEVREIALDYAQLFAGTQGQDLDDEFLTSFAEMASGFIDERSRRIWDLMERSGWQDAAETLRSHDLLVEGLREVAGKRG